MSTQTQLRTTVSSLFQVNPTPAGPSSSMRSLNPALPADPRLTSALLEHHFPGNHLKLVYLQLRLLEYGR